MKQEVLLGDEAVALAALHAGIGGAFSYPGTPATEIFEYIRSRRPDNGNPVAANWSANEKVAYEEALGMSFAGRRALASMKHVGLNVAADPFVSSALTGAHGGLVLAVADDPGMHSSQNEQDSRHYARFALIPLLEPSNQQEAYEMTREAFDLSESYGLPVMVRLVTRLAHSRANVTVAEPREQLNLGRARNTRDWTLLPVNARRRYKVLTGKLDSIRENVEQSRFNRLNLKGRTGVIAAGMGHNYLMEAIGQESDHSVLKIGYYPFPVAMIRKLVDHCDDILVVEDGYPFIESHLIGLLGIPGKSIRGKLSGDLPRTGELTPDVVRAAVRLEELPTRKPIDDLPPRPPQLCKGCPHIESFTAIKEALESYDDRIVFGDIGCYTLGALPPLEVGHTCVDMGASISMARGASLAGHRPALCVIGDSTFTHSGMTGLLGAAQDDTNMTVFILDNSIVAMTGGQETLIGADSEMKRLIEGLGVNPEHILEIDPVVKWHEDNVKAIRKEIEHDGLSVIISKRACIQIKKK